jgi:hypothetical protein
MGLPHASVGSCQTNKTHIQMKTSGNTVHLSVTDTQVIKFHLLKNYKTLP